MLRLFCIIILQLLCHTCCAVLAAHSDPLSFSFETGDTGGWRVVEGWFGKLITERERYHSIDAAYVRDGRYFLSTLENTDGSPDDSFTGVIESSVFVLDNPTIRFMVGGGHHADTYVALITLDESIIITASGNNSEKMKHVEWRVPEVIGTPVFLRIVDQNSGGWGHVTFDGFTASGTIDSTSTRARFGDMKRLNALRRLKERTGTIDLAAVENAVRDLTASFSGDYSHGGDFLSRLDTIAHELNAYESRFGGLSVDDIKNADALLDEAESLQKQALLANPLLTRNPILFTVRRQYLPDHHNTATIFQTGEVNTGSFRGGSALKVLDVGNGGVTTLIESTDGVIRDPEVSWNGEHIVFSMRRHIRDDYHIYEVNADGTGLRALTSVAGVADIDPVYLPDGDIAFSSTREPKYCMCNKHIMANLFRMEPDGANIHQIGKSTLFEGHGSILPDGRILYDRWEYVDRNFGDAQGLWTCNPDGTNHALYWGNNTNSPGGVIDARAIPGTQRAVCVFGNCHDRPWGAMAVIDRRYGLDLREPVVRTWPKEAIDIVGHGNWDAFIGVRPKYEDPWPLSDKYFLCSRMTGEGERMGLYLADVFGNEILIHTEGPGCFDPMPLGPRPRPNVIPSRRNFTDITGRFYIVDVCEGTHMQGVEREAVKYLRVVESPEKRTWNALAWSGQGTLWPAMNWHDFLNKRILGTVPVEEDGSVFFELPAEKFVYFQLLDKNGMMIQSMRSGTYVQPGETTGCIGCHDHRLRAPATGPDTMPSAVTNPPATLDGWNGPPRMFSYLRDVQPVFDNSCVRCHDFGKPAGERLNLSGDRTLTFNVSYNELWRKKFIASIGGGPSDIQQAYSWGSHASRLVDVILSGHKGVHLDRESIDRIITWIDINGPYYPEYATAYPGHLAGRSPLDFASLDRLTELTGIPFRKLAGHDRNRGPQISFDRPELSPCLTGLEARDPEGYSEALAIIEGGAEQLVTRPRGDMEGFVPCMVDQLRLGKYGQRSVIEAMNRRAIQQGETLYDFGLRSEEETTGTVINTTGEPHDGTGVFNEN